MKISISLVKTIVLLILLGLSLNIVTYYISSIVIEKHMKYYEIDYYTEELRELKKDDPELYMPRIEEIRKEYERELKLLPAYKKELSNYLYNSGYLLQNIAVSLKYLIIIGLFSILSLSIGIISGLARAMSKTRYFKIGIVFISSLIKSLPKILLALLLVMLFTNYAKYSGEGSELSGFFLLMKIFVLLALIDWVETADIIYYKTKEILKLPFVLNAYNFGAGSREIVFKHIRPLLLSTISANFFNRVISLMVLESTLGFLGYGAAPEFSLGSGLGDLLSEMLQNRSDDIFILNHLPQLVFPIFCLGSIIILFTIFNKNIKERHLNNVL